MRVPRKSLLSITAALTRRDFSHLRANFFNLVLFSPSSTVFYRERSVRASIKTIIFFVKLSILSLHQLYIALEIDRSGVPLTSARKFTIETEIYIDERFSQNNTHRRIICPSAVCKYLLHIEFNSISIYHSINLHHSHARVKTSEKRKIPGVLLIPIVEY